MRFPHPILFWHPTLVGLWVSAGLVCVGMSEVIRSVDRSVSVHKRVAEVESALAAEEAAFAFAARGPSLEPYRTAGGFVCTVSSTSPGTDTVMAINVRDRFGAEHRFACTLLPGAMSRAFGCAFSVLARGDEDPMARVRNISADRPVPLTPAEWPTLDPTIRDLPTNTWRRMGGIRKDSSLALQRLPTGTDRPDYVLEDPNGSVVSPSVPSSGVLRLDGHLWVDAAPRPLTLQLSRDLTIVVTGNLYLGRSIHVRGRGRLVIVVSRGTGDMFRDLDLDGAWSKGDELLTALDRPFRGSVEGSGAVYFGLPAGNPVPDRIRIDAAVVADGEVHIQSAVTEVWGALAVGHGVTGAQRHRLLTPGLLLPDTLRERISGFQPLGGPRPGILRRL